MPKNKVRVKFASTKRLFNLSEEAIINVRNARLCDRCAIFLSKIKRIPFLSFGPGVYNFEKSPKAIQDVIGDVYGPDEYCRNRKKCESIGGFVKNPRSIFAFGNFGAWLFVHKLPFTLQDHVKTTRTDKTRTFIAKKDKLGTQQTIVT